jgi:branched-chain amino acid transport system ATP-binding protein
MLTLNNVEVIYGGAILVLRGVTMEVGEGTLVVLLGANGAGKSTVLKAISGLLKIEQGEVTDGSIEFDMVRIDGKGPQEIAKMGILQVVEGRRICQHLTTEENLLAGALILGRSETKRRLDMVYEYISMLRNLRHQTSGYLSGGEQQMLVIGRALMAHPKLMLLDEPSLGLAPLMVKEIFNIIQRVRVGEKTAILLVEQNAVAGLSIAEYAYVMEMGKIVLQGPSSKMKDNEQIRKFYLGVNELGQRKSYRDVKRYRRKTMWNPSIKLT